MFYLEEIRGWLMGALKDNAIASSDANTQQKATWFNDELRAIIQLIGGLPPNHSEDQVKPLFERLSVVALKIQLEVQGSKVIWLTPTGPSAWQNSELAAALRKLQSEAGDMDIEIPLNYPHGPEWSM